MPDSHYRTVDGILQGVEGEMIGEDGLAYGDSAGVALYRYDHALWGRGVSRQLGAGSTGHA